MKLSLIALAAAATICAGAFGTGPALATTTSQASTKTLTIAMHDPGCHWFLVKGKYTKTATVTGSVRLRNLDEDTLKVSSSHGTQRIPVGKSILVRRGHYVITMVGQESDDNHLKLTVR
jgi:hypothetical protein